MLEYNEINNTYSDELIQYLLYRIEILLMCWTTDRNIRNQLRDKIQEYDPNVTNWGHDIDVLA